MIFWMRRSCTIPLVLGLFVACHKPKDPPILSLGDQEVRRSDFDRHLKALEAEGASVDQTTRTALLESFLEERVLVLEARSRGLVSPESSAADEQVAVQKMLNDDVLSKIQVSEDEIAAYYKDHSDEFHAPETVTLRQILVSTESEAREIERHVQKEPKSFEGIARAQSRSPEAAAGGLMGGFSKGELPSELEEAAFALPIGGIQLVKTGLGYHVLKVEARGPARDRPLDDCRAQVRDLLVRQKSDQSVHDIVRDLMARAKVNHEAATDSSHQS
jgi:peptidyl-prolyl cis-trans isomerase C